MASRLTVRLPEELRRAVELAAAKSHRTVSEVVRVALRQFLNRTSSEHCRAERVGDLIGSIQSRIPDLAERHRGHILESLKNVR